MTYEEFKYQVRKLGLYFNTSDEVIKVGTFDGNKFEEVCNIYLTKRFSFYQTHKFYELDESLRKKVFELVTWLSRTAIDNRGDLYKETKWYLKHKYLNVWNGENYLRIDMERKDLSLGSKKADGIIWISKFTKYDLDQLANRININEFKKENVE